ncbi:MAG TPA: signal peptidase I [Stellaceae bacterium]
MRSRTSGGAAETLKTLIYAIVIALFIRTFFYEPFNIPSASMVPTLLVGDYLFVSKFSYGYSRYSLPFGVPLIPGRVFYKPPKRGDVVVFKLPREPSTDYIKRVIGLPGDRIQLKQGLLYINDAPVKREPSEDCDVPSEEARGMVYQRYWETLPEGVRHCIVEMGDNMSLDNTGVFVVPPDHYFMMGDNRDNSADSRDPNSGVGYVPAVNLVGRAEFIFFSTNGYAHWWEIWNWPFTIRYDRLFKAIH